MPHLMSGETICIHVCGIKFLIPARSKERNEGTKKEQTQNKQASKKSSQKASSAQVHIKNRHFLIFVNSHGGKYKDSGLQYVTAWGLVDRCHDSENTLSFFRVHVPLTGK